MMVAPVAAALLSISSFAVQQAFTRVGKSSVGFCLPFGLYALTNLFIAIFTLFVVPETRGRTLMQVQDELRPRPVRRWGSLLRSSR